MNNLHILAPAPITRKLLRLKCTTCEKKTWFTCWHYEWYGSSKTCLRCGENFADNQRCERPFAPGWRKRSIQDAKRLWRMQNARGDVKP